MTRHETVDDQVDRVVGIHEYDEDDLDESEASLGQIAYGLFVLGRVVERRRHGQEDHNGQRERDEHEIVGGQHGRDVARLGGRAALGRGRASRGRAASGLVEHGGLVAAGARPLGLGGRGSRWRRRMAARRHALAHVDEAEDDDDAAYDHDGERYEHVHGQVNVDPEGVEVLQVRYVLGRAVDDVEVLDARVRIDHVAGNVGRDVGRRLVAVRIEEELQVEQEKAQRDGEHDAEGDARRGEAFGGGRLATAHAEEHADDAVEAHGGHRPRGQLGQKVDEKGEELAEERAHHLQVDVELIEEDEVDAERVHGHEVDDAQARQVEERGRLAHLLAREHEKRDDVRYARRHEYHPRIDLQYAIGQLQQEADRGRVQPILLQTIRRRRRRRRQVKVDESVECGAGERVRHRARRTRRRRHGRSRHECVHGIVELTVGVDDYLERVLLSAAVEQNIIVMVVVVVVVVDVDVVVVRVVIVVVRAVRVVVVVVVVVVDAVVAFGVPKV